MPITLEICTKAADGLMKFVPIGGTYDSLETAMKAAQQFAGRDARYSGDRRSIFYTGADGTVYLCGTTA